MLRTVNKYDRMFSTKEIIDLQKFLKVHPAGIVNEETLAAARKKVVAPISPKGDHLIASLQMMCGAKVDGLFGPETDEKLLHYVGGDSYVEYPDYSRLTSIYGKPGENLVTQKIPFTLKLAWDVKIKVNKITCHIKVIDPIISIFDQAIAYYGWSTMQEMGLDLYGGMYNDRKMRGGTKLSTHAWGVAIDIDPARNRLNWGSDKAMMANPEYFEFVRIFELHGWTSLGKTLNYDWMHFQALKP